MALHWIKFYIIKNLSDSYFEGLVQSVADAISGLAFAHFEESNHWWRQKNYNKLSLSKKDFSQFRQAVKEVSAETEVKLRGAANN